MGNMAAKSASGGLNSRDARSDSGAPGRNRVRLYIEGVVQGVGFRPFVYRLATQLGLTGWVRNTSQDVRIEVEGPHQSVQQFIHSLRTAAPSLSRIHHIEAERVGAQGSTRFEILESQFAPDKGQLISPDVATCTECMAEVLDCKDRRYRYPFTNCTNCGPRFTIITDMPYDRAHTTMANFTMCPECREEYEDPANRRFHAQPNACPVCGPQLSLVDSSGEAVHVVDPIARTATLLRDSRIVAVKGLGGFLLACDATASSAVQDLRQRKQRPSKPFAIMVRDIQTARIHCELTTEEETLLLSHAAPIVLSRWKAESTICPDVAPGLAFLGIMLPYTPLHHVLLRELDCPLVMTSGNLSEEPIAAENEEALSRLHTIADYFLLHNRQIHSRYDDSVAMITDDEPHILRRARGYAPYPIQLPLDSPAVLAVGPQAKNSFCLAHKHRAFVSQHIGDLDSIETLDHFETTIALYRRLFGIEPEIIAHDLHPDYASTTYARQLAATGLKSVAVQHHHAHITSCMVENGVEDPVIGVAFDGSGLGSDGHIWGGEFLVADLSTSRRAAHLEYLPLPGGDAAILRPYRTATAYLATLLGEQSLQRSSALRLSSATVERETILRQIESHLNTPLTSSMGRLFDAIAALTGVRGTIDYDGQAAIELEMQAHKCHAVSPLDRYHFGIDRTDEGYLLRIADVLEAVLQDIEHDVGIPVIAAAFHKSVSVITCEVCRLISSDTGIRTIALSGGVFQNTILLEMVSRQMRADGFKVIRHRHLPPNDGCVSLGQAVTAACFK